MILTAEIERKYFLIYRTTIYNLANSFLPYCRSRFTKKLIDFFFSLFYDPDEAASIYTFEFITESFLLTKPDLHMISGNLHFFYYFQFPAWFPRKYESDIKTTSFALALSKPEFYRI
jgi:hypothetical protein